MAGRTFRPAWSSGSAESLDRPVCSIILHPGIETARLNGCFCPVAAMKASQTGRGIPSQMQNRFLIGPLTTRGGQGNRGPTFVFLLPWESALQSSMILKTNRQ